MIDKPMTKQLSLRSIAKGVKEGKINLDLRIQRNSVWKLEQKQMLIASILENYDIPYLYGVESSDILYMLDGKQRILTVCSFLRDEFATPEEFDDIDEKWLKEYEVSMKDICGKKFSELPQVIQSEIGSHPFNFRVYKSLTDEQVRNLFYRLNRGTALSRMELLRINCDFMLDEIRQIGNMPFFTKYANLSDTMKNGFIDEEIILQSLALSYYDGKVGLGKKEMESFIEDIKQLKETDVVGFRREVNSVINVYEYLSKAFENAPTVHQSGKIKELRKLHIPIVAYIAKIAMEDEIGASKFGAWCANFLRTNTGRGSNTPYKLACEDKTASQHNVSKRIECMLADFKENINSVITGPVQEKEIVPVLEIEQIYTEG